MKHSKLALASLAAAALTFSGAALAEHHEGGDGHKKGKKGHYFEKVDTNGDGQISKEEHMTAAEERFTKMDTNGDGAITKEEVQEKMKKMHGKYKKDKGQEADIDVE